MDTLRRIGTLKSGLLMLVSLIVLLKSCLGPYEYLLRDLCMPDSPHYIFRVLLPRGFEHHMNLNMYFCRIECSLEFS